MQRWVGMSKVTTRLLERYYSDLRFDGTTAFYDWMRSGLRPDQRVLNLGAGPATGTRQRSLKGEVAEVVGADVDPVVLSNVELDRAVLIENGYTPLPSNYFDLIYSDFVLEHIEFPEQFMSEVARMLKPGGSFMFRTPNIFHYVAIISRFTPHSFHEKVANPARGLNDDTHAPWPTFYRMNSRSRLKKLAVGAGFDQVELRMIECEPSYLTFHVIPFLIGMAYERLVNSTGLFAGLRVNILGRFVKSSAAPTP